MSGANVFQIRPRTRIDLHGELAGSLKSGRNQYDREDVATFLQRRWLGSSTPKSALRNPHSKKETVC